MPSPNHGSLNGAQGLVIRALALALVLISQASPAFAELPLAKAEGAGAPEASLPLQDLEAERSRVEAHIQEAQAQLAGAKEALQASDLPPSPEDQESLDQRIALLQARIQVGRRHQKLFEEAKAIREEKEKLQAEINTWTRLPDPRPTHSTLSRAAPGS